METKTPDDREAVAKAALAAKRAAATTSALALSPDNPLYIEALEAFARAQSKFNKIAFDKTNPHFGSKYASLKATLAATTPALLAENIMLLTLPAVSGENMVLEARLVYKGLCFARGEWAVGKVGTQPQAMGSSNTYARRYLIQDILGVVAEEDDDGNAAQNGHAAAVQAPPAF